MVDYVNVGVIGYGANVDGLIEILGQMEVVGIASLLPYDDPVKSL